MFSKVRERLGGAGLAVAILALIAALSGGAFAASQSATQSAKKSSKSLTKAQIVKLIKQHAGSGPKGDAGAPGGQGAQGPQGGQGPQGPQGPPGDPGDQGDPGPAGKGIDMTPATLFECDELGGAILEKEGEPASATEVCNGEPGEPGEPGPKGEPWTPDNTLPAGATLTGVWGLSVVGDSNDAADESVFAPISFPIQLPSNLSFGRYHVTGEVDFATFCTGGPVVPKANPGHLCIYYNPAGLEKLSVDAGNPVANVGGQFTTSPTRTGAFVRLTFEGEPGEAAWGMGSFAVTGCGVVDGKPELACP